MATQRVIKFDSLANSVSAAELATTNANTAKTQADTARDEALAAATEALASSDINPNYISYEVGVLPTTVGVPTGTIGAYYTTDGNFQKLIIEGGEWKDYGEPITTKKYVDDKASLLQDQVDAFSGGEGKTYESLGTGAGEAMEAPVPVDNVPFRIDAGGVDDGNYIYLASEPNGYKFLSSLIKKQTGELDPANSGVVPSSKNVGEYYATEQSTIYKPTATDANYEYMFRLGIVSCEIFNKRSDLDYHFVIYRNVSGSWRVDLRGYDGINPFTTRAQFNTSISPEPSEDGVLTTHKLIPVGGSNYGFVTIDWSRFPVGTPVGGAGTMELGEGAFKNIVPSLRPNLESINTGSKKGNLLSYSGAVADPSMWIRKRWVRGVGTSYPNSRLLATADDYNDAVVGGAATSNYVPTGVYEPSGLLYFATKIDGENVLSLWSLQGDLSGKDPTYIGNPIEGVGATWEVNIKEAVMRLDVNTSTIHYWYKGSDGAGNIAVGYATAPQSDPTNTTKDSGNPILTASDLNTALGVADIYDVNITSVIRNPNAKEGDSDLYWFYGSYSREPFARGYQQKDYIYGIWFGTGPDLSTISVQNTLLDALTSATNLAYMPCVWYNDASECFVMVFSDVTELTTNRAIGGLRVAISATGTGKWKVLDHWLIKPQVYGTRGSTIENRIYSSNIIVGNTPDTWATPMLINSVEGRKLAFLISTSEGGDNSGMYYMTPNAGRKPDSSVRVRMERDTVLAVPNNTWTSIPWNEVDLEATKDFDIIWTNNETDAYIRRDGLYKLNASVVFASNSTGDRGIRFLINGSGTPIPLTQVRASNGFTAIINSGELYLSAGTKIEVQIYQNSGASLNTENSWGNAKFEITGELT